MSKKALDSGLVKRHGCYAVLGSSDTAINVEVAPAMGTCMGGCVPDNGRVRRLAAAAMVLVAVLAAVAVDGGTASTASTGVPNVLPGTGSQRAPIEAPSASWAAATSAPRFADQVLASAPVLPGARPWHGKVPSVLGEAPMGIGGTSDLHRFYLVSAAVASELPGFVTGHLPAAKLESSGLGSQVDEFLFVLPTFGPHEYLAALEYATSTSAGEPCSNPGAIPVTVCLLRLDAVTTWEPSRSATEVVPNGDRARVTGFASLSIFRSSGPVVATLGPARSAQLVRAFDSLPLGEGPGCHEDQTLYEIEFWPADGPGPHYQVQGEGCEAVVFVSVGAKVLHPLSDSACSLRKLVQQLLPPTAKATRAVVGACPTPT